MAEDTSLRAHAWTGFYPLWRGAHRLAASVVLMLIFCVAAAYAQMQPVNAPSSSAPPSTTPATTTRGGAATAAPAKPDKTQTRTRRATNAGSSSTGAVSPSTTTSSSSRQAPPSDAAEPSAAMPEQEAPKGDRISNLRAQINDETDKQERARLQRTLVDYLVALNRQSEAIKELREMMRADRVDPVGFYNIGNALARLGDTPTAIDAYRKAIEQRHGNYARALNNLGVLLIRQERWDEALEALASALKQENLRYAEASYNLGRVYAARGETKLAIAEWSRALFVQPDHLDAALLLARAHAAAGNPERGIAVIDAFVAREGPNKALIDTRNEILAGLVGVETKTSAARAGQ